MMRQIRIHALGLILLASACGLVAFAPSNATAKIITVNSTGDAGQYTPGLVSCWTGNSVVGAGGASELECTLRAAIEHANAFPDHDTITFSDALNVVGGSVIISPADSLPVILEPVEIRGDIAPTYDFNDPFETPVITLSGTGVSAPGGMGLIIANVTGVRIKGLSIVGFPSNGILIENSHDTLIEGCHIGVWRGFIVLGNGGDGIFEDVNSTGSTFGFTPGLFGIYDGSPNVIAASGSDGIHTQGTGTTIVGNRIGTDRTGTTLQPAFSGYHGNAGWGILISGEDTRVGADSTTFVSGYEGNVISGNELGGIHQDSGASNTEIIANRIGSNIYGTAALGNGSSGIGILLSGDGATVGRATPSGVPSPAENVISGNAGGGIRVSGATGAITIKHNRIGVSLDGTLEIGNGVGGLFINAGIPAVEVHGNWIGSNAGYGMFVGNNGSQVWANWIGTTPSGAAVGNGSQGILLRGSSNIIGAPLGATPAELDSRANTIRFNQTHAIWANNPSSTSNTVRGNRISNNAGIGFDLGSSGSNGNDPGDLDPGPNRLQNSPVFDTSVSGINSTSGDVHLGYRVDGFPGATTYPMVVDFYLASSDIEPLAYFGSADYPLLSPTNQVQVLSVAPDPALGLSSSSRIVAIATDGQGNSSEQSAWITLPEPGTALGLSIGCVAILLAPRTRGSRRSRASTKRCQAVRPSGPDRPARTSAAFDRFRQRDERLAQRLGLSPRIPEARPFPSSTRPASASSKASPSLRPSPCIRATRRSSRSAAGSGWRSTGST